MPGPSSSSAICRVSDAAARIAHGPMLTRRTPSPSSAGFGKVTVLHTGHLIAQDGAWHWTLSPQSLKRSAPATAPRTERRAPPNLLRACERRPPDGLFRTPLISGEWPSFAVASEQGDDAGVRDGQLHAGVRRAISSIR